MEKYAKHKSKQSRGPSCTGAKKDKENQNNNEQGSLNITKHSTELDLKESFASHKLFIRNERGKHIKVKTFSNLWPSFQTLKIMDVFDGAYFYFCNLEHHGDGHNKFTNDLFLHIHLMFFRFDILGELMAM